MQDQQHPIVTFLPVFYLSLSRLNLVSTVCPSGVWILTDARAGRKLPGVELQHNLPRVDQASRIQRVSRPNNKDRKSLYW